MDNGLKEFELLLSKYTRLLNELDPKHKNSQITGEAYNMIIQDAKKGIARAKSRNENSGLHLQRVSCMLPSQKDIDEAVCKHYDNDDTSLAVERLAFANGAEWCKEQTKELLSNCS